jgi:putative SbcD/Mre11-related phosphoesterase
MNILPGIQIIDLGLYLVKSKTLIFADFHIGYEEELNKKGVLVPHFQYKDVIDRLEMIFSKAKECKMVIDTIVINGDLKHEFGTISKQEWKETLRLIDYFERKCKKIVLIKGNHDTILGPIARKKNIEIVDELAVDDALIMHGHKLPKEEQLTANGKRQTLIIAHEHPAIGLRSDVRVEKYKCFLKGKYKKSNLIVQPSFNLITDGNDITAEKVLSPLLPQDLSSFEIFVIDEQKKEALYFGKLRNL